MGTSFFFQGVGGGGGGGGEEGRDGRGGEGSGCGVWLSNTSVVI